MKHNLQACVTYVAQRFVYDPDSKRIDSWSVMKERDGKMRGDCDDFAITVLYLYYGGLLGFIINVMILHRGFIWFVKTQSGDGHAVGTVGGKYFDNWMLKHVASDKSEVTRLTGHRFKFPMIAPFSWIKLLLGVFVR